MGKMVADVYHGLFFSVSIFMIRKLMKKWKYCIVHKFEVIDHHHHGLCHFLFL